MLQKCKRCSTKNWLWPLNNFTHVYLWMELDFSFTLLVVNSMLFSKLLEYVLINILWLFTKAFIFSFNFISHAFLGGWIIWVQLKLPRSGKWESFGNTWLDILANANWIHYRCGISPLYAGGTSLWAYTRCWPETGVSDNGKKRVGPACSDKKLVLHAFLPWSIKMSLQSIICCVQ